MSSIAYLHLKLKVYYTYLNNEWLQILLCRESSKLSINNHICKVNSDKNIKRKETKNDYSPHDINYTFRRLLHAL